MRCDYACRSDDHAMSRRRFVVGSSAGVAGAFGIGLFAERSSAAQLQAAQKRVLVIDLSGGVSQLESWDPKPNTDTGGPFRPIPTSTPGTHICELLPHTAKQMHRLSLIRSINIKENDHGRARYFMERGRRKAPVADYPHFGSVAAKVLAPEDSPLPGFIHITPGGGGGSNKSDAAFLGPRYASVSLGGGKPPANIARGKSLTEESDRRRNQLREKLTRRFAQGRRTARTEAYSYSYDQAEKLMKRKDVFDLSKEPKKDLDRYGSHDFGRHCLLARRLLENDITFVRVSHSNYDTHFENFDFHIEQLGEFDRPFATLVGDLAERGMLESTLVVVMSEFGRTPKINRNYGRDHWGTAWSIALGGCGIQPGAVVGKTNANGTAVTDRQVDAGHLFHTYFRAVGIDPTEDHDITGRSIPLGDPSTSAIEELLA